MDRLTHRTSTIIVSIGGRTKCFRSFAEVPPGLRRRIAQTTAGGNSATLVIADEKGREEILKGREPVVSTKGIMPPPWRHGLKLAVEAIVIAAAGVVMWFALSGH